MAPPTLRNMAQRACIKNVAGITDVGDLPYDMVQPILKKVGSPEQLRTIEQASPQIAGEDAELWQAFIKRDIPDGAKRIETNTPNNPLSWWKVYRKLMKEEEVKRTADEENLKASLNRAKLTKEGKSAHILNSIIPEARKGVWNGPRDKPAGFQAMKNAKTTRDKLAILKRQTAARASLRGTAQAMPSHELALRRSVIKQAPQSMLNQYNKRPLAVQQPIAPQAHSRPAVFVSKTRDMSDRDRTINAQIRKEQEEKERRLRALTGASASAPSAPSSRPSSSQPSSAANPVPTAMPRKRAAYDPLMPAKRRKP